MKCSFARTSTEEKQMVKSDLKDIYNFRNEILVHQINYNEPSEWATKVKSHLKNRR